MNIPIIHGYDANRTIVDRPDGAVTQQTLLAQAAALTEQLPRHVHVINLCEDRYYFLLAFVGAIQAGRITLLPPSKHVKDIVSTVRRYPDTIIVGDGNLPDESNLTTVDLRKLDLYIDAANPTAAEIPIEQPVAVAFTSGSTGQPSAHTKLWGTLANTCQRLAERFAFAERNPTIVATVPSQHMYGLEMTAMAALQGGARLACTQPFYPRDIAACLHDSHNPLLVTTPVHLRAAIRANIDFPRASHIVSATAPLASELANIAEHLFDCQLEEIYGCTEAGSIATRRTTEGDDWHLLDGFAFDTTSCEPTLKVPFLPEPVVLQDQIETTPVGFRLLGRNADMLNVAGKRYSLADLNTALQNLSEIDDAIAFIPDETTDVGRPVAFVVSEHPIREIGAALAKEIDPTFIPRPIIKVASIPRNATGKVVRSDLLALLKKA